jgi:hypothetical protein
MKRLVYPKRPHHCEYPEDIKRIVHACETYGYSLSEADAERFWSDYSESYCAGWLTLPTEDSMIVEIVKKYCCEVEIKIL